MFNIDVLLPDFWSILGAVPRTLGMALLIFVLSTLSGSVLAAIEHRGVPILRELVAGYKVVFKGVPMVIMLFLTYYGLPSIIRFMNSLLRIKIDAFGTPNWVVVIVALTACVAAFQAEIVKGALNSFDSGQADAAHSLGYKGSQLFRRILFPQVIVAALPDLVTSCMVIMKALSLAFAIEVIDIFAQAQLTAALNFYYFEAFVITVAFYMVIAYLITKTADRLEAALRVRG
jgi:L-cystine transport system permease protein